MKTNDLRMMTLLLGLTLTFSSPVYAAIGGDSGGGGDALEARVNEIRSDLLNWIEKGGAEGLVLPTYISYSDYVSKMSDILENKKVALSFTHEDVEVNGVEKTCRGSFYVKKTFFSKKEANPQILCNISRFKETSESKQYSLIHHEYAGLVNIERNDGSASDYEISNQLTDYLEDSVVKKLAVKKKTEPDVKPDLTLRRMTVKRVRTYNKEESLVECRPFHKQLLKDHQAKIDEEIIIMNDLVIKGYYEKNGLTKVIDTKLLSKTVKKEVAARTTQIVYIIAVNAGDDSAQLKFEMNIDGEYKPVFEDNISNIVDTLGRIKARELSCSFGKGYDLSEEPFVHTSLTNAESGYALDSASSYYYKTVYEKAVSIKKEL
jgi:hypothetical protein